MKKILVSLSLLSTMSAFATSFGEPPSHLILDSKSRPLFYCRPYIIQIKETNTNNIKGYLSYQNWFFNRYDYIIEKKDTSSENKASLVTFEPTDPNFQCKENGGLEPTNNAPMISDAEFIKKTDFVFVRFEAPTYESYNYLNKTTWDNYYLDSKGKKLNLKEFQSSINCNFWCSYTQGKKSEAVFITP
jgi:hypothetical protein